jgi:glyoxylase-like metal-dependent hydrolase (beta-lactamase superfamily II)
VYTTPRYLRVNVYLVETENGLVVVDGATALSTSREIRRIADQEIRKPLLAVLLTHGHPDHYVGVGEIIGGLDVPFVATRGAADFAREQDREKFDTLIKRNYGDDCPGVRVFPDRIVSDGDELVLDGVRFRVHDLGPCESGADSMWVMSDGDVRHVFLGDLVYNHTHCYLRDGHALRWLRALDHLLDEFDHTARLYPGHGLTCGTEIAHWQKAYIGAFLGALHSRYRGPGSEASIQEDLVATMQSFLPDDLNLNLLRFELTETIRLLAADPALAAR